MDPVVILASDTVSAGPGGEARLQARVRNQGRRVESYTIEVVGVPASFAQVEPTSVSVLPGKEAEITITFRPPVGASTPTGSLPFAVRAVSEVGSSSSAVAEGRLELSGAAGLQAWADATTAAGRWSASYRLWFANQGNAPARLFVRADDPSASVRLSVRDEVLSVPPGAQVDTEVKARARQPFLRGSVVNRVITASCQDFPFGAERPAPGQPPSRDDPNHRTFQLTFQQKPVLSKLVLALGALAIAALVAFALLRFRSGKGVALDLARPNPPSTLTIEGADSTTISLAWSAVPNALGYDIRNTTAEGQPTGPPIDQVDATTLRYMVKDLDPGQTLCFAVEATGPEDVGKSEPSEFQCATTTAAPTLATPANFQASEEAEGTGRFAVSWEATMTPEVTFTVYANGKAVEESIAALATTIELEQLEAPYEAELKVIAIQGDQRSDFSNPVTVTVAALPATTDSAGPATTAAGDGGTATTAAGGGGVGGDGGAGGGGGGGTPGGGTTATTATTAVPNAAQGEIKDLVGRWVSVLGPVQAVPAGATEDQQRALLARDFNVSPADLILTFSNRDTAIQGSDPRVPTIAGAPAGTRFFYVQQPNELTAGNFCGQDIRCNPAFIEGAPTAAEGTSVARLDRLPLTARLTEIDELLASARESYPEVYVLDGRTREQFGDNELVVFASGFVDEQAASDFCAARGLTPATCAPIVLAPEP